MVEIEVYSTVGASEVVAAVWRVFRTNGVAKMWRRSAATAEEWAKSEGKDIVKMV